MVHRLEKYLGRTVEMIYIDRYGTVSQRRVVVRSVEGSVVRAFCLHRRAPRVFRLDHILAVTAVKGMCTG